MHNKRSGISSINDIPLTYLFSKLDEKVIDVGIDKNKNFAVEKLKHKVVARNLKGTEEKIAEDQETRGNGIILFTIIIRIITAIKIIDHG